MKTSSLRSLRNQHIVHCGWQKEDKKIFRKPSKQSKTTAAEETTTLINKNIIIVFLVLYKNTNKKQLGTWNPYEQAD